MELQFSVIGFVIIVVFYTLAGGLLALLWLGVKRWRYHWWLLGPLVPLVLALPIVDEVWIAWHFHELCKGAGVHVLRKVEVEGYVVDTSRSSLRSSRYGPEPRLLYDDPDLLESFDRRGYRYKEYMRKGGGVWHVERYPDGVYASILDQPTARYHYKKPHKNGDIGFQLAMSEYVVSDSQTGEILGRKRIYKRYPGWVEGLWIRFLGSGMTMCPDPEKGPFQPPFPEVVLVPAKQ